VTISTLTSPVVQANILQILELLELPSFVKLRKMVDFARSLQKLEFDSSITTLVLP